MKYNRFYNLHIPKTGGTYFRENILLPNEKYFNENKIKTNPPGGAGIGLNNSPLTVHWAWYPEFVKDNSYIYTCFRDPAQRTVSHFCWLASRSIYDKKTNYTKFDINKKTFFKWLNYYYDFQSNFQAKNIIYKSENKNDYYQSKNLRWEDGDIPKIDHPIFTKFNNILIDQKQLNDNLNRINLKIRSTYLKNNEDKLINKIFLDLGLDVNKIQKNNKYGHQNSISQDIYNSLSKEDISKLYEMSSIDSEIYFTNSIFTMSDDIINL